MVPPVVPLQSGGHVLGSPVQAEPPAASKAYSFPSTDGRYTTPFATAGNEFVKLVSGPVQSGAQTFGTPEHQVTPAASTAWIFPPLSQVPM